MTDTAHTTLPTAAKHARRPVMPMSMSPGMLLLRGLVAAGVAVLAGLAITYLVRVMLNADAFQSAGSVNGAGFPNSGALSAGIAIATLLAVVRWIDSDAVTRTDDELLRAAMKELGFARLGPRIKESLGAAVTAVRG